MVTRRPKRRPIFDGDIVRIPLTRGRVASIDSVDSALADFTWTATERPRTWYAYRHQPEPSEKLVYLHREVAAAAGIAKPGMLIDHIDGDGLNCRRGNLRAATLSQNQFNKKIPSTNTSGYKGVTKHKRSGKWQAQIKAHGKYKCLGMFSDPVSASLAYQAAAEAMHGEFARNK